MHRRGRGADPRRRPRRRVALRRAGDPDAIIRRRAAHRRSRGWLLRRA
jgi:hypothetical protein